MKILNRIGEYFTCLLYENCDYSIKKCLIFIFTSLVIYTVIFTDKSYYDLLIFIGALVGVRFYEKKGDMVLGKRYTRPKVDKEVLAD